MGERDRERETEPEGVKDGRETLNERRARDVEHERERDGGGARSKRERDATPLIPPEY